jgi:hypothetical protein
MLAGQPSERRIARLAVVALVGGGMVCGVFSTLTFSSTLKMTAILGTFALPAVALVMLLAIFGRLPGRTLMALFAVVVDWMCCGSTGRWSKGDRAGRMA